MKWLSHLYFRKRISADTLEPFPAKDLRLIILDEIVLVVGVIGPLTTIPQILKIFILQDATGVSTLSWGLSALFDIPWIMYGIVHKERPITIAYTLWLIMNLAVFVGALVYGAGAF
ncbi:hypothetical protein C4585_00795 [Candidatus Parcubacteria bacterium]|nr:MAG: hypothetical protein C4585_00795 [Candidatus Parcubacteria bacterium]